MHQPQVTIAVVPREQFSLTARSLESIFRSTNYPFRMIYVDGGSPRRIRTYLEAQAQERGFELIRASAYLSPNRARNLALRRVDTKYVVFVDNDVIVRPGWLAALIRCAEETGAWIVGPVYCIGEPAFRTIHMAGGLAHITEDHGRRDLKEEHRFIGRLLDHVQTDLRREPTELVEFHSMLVRTRVFETTGGLDENLFSSPEHIDICLTVRQLGGEIFLAPESFVTYLSPPPLARSDFNYFMLRWSDEWNRKSLDHFRDKWNLSTDSLFLERHLRWLTRHRRLVTSDPVRDQIRRLTGWRLGTWIARTLLEPAEAAFNAYWVRRFADSLTSR
jgi:GT2 family glycosyltransferase